MTTTSLIAAFMRNLSGRATAQPMASLEERLVEMSDRAEQAWPSFSVERVELVERLARGFPADVSLDEGLEQARVEDLYLALGCAKGLPRAIDALRRTYGSGIERAVRAIRSSVVGTDELLQAVYHHLLVARASTDPAIARYGGSGSLAVWLRVTCSRAALLEARRAERGAATSSVDEDVLALARSPELDIIRRQHSKEFRAAFEAAAASLTARQRSLLRQSIVNGLTVRQLARIYEVHYATVSRWVVHARTALVEQTRARLCERLGLDGPELDEFMGDLTSQLDLTLSRILQVQDGET